jgi:putative ATPase
MATAKARPAVAEQPAFLDMGPVGAAPEAEPADTPLAARMRPRTFDEFAGQEHLIAPGRLLRRAIEQDTLGSIILWGPPGSGKTTLAEVIARLTRAQFIRVSAVSAGVAELRRAADAARTARATTDRRTILFVDEIHRFNKAQQDAVLPVVESGLLTLIGATTENPSFSVNGALLSRCRVFRLEALGDSAVEGLIRRALEDCERGLGGEGVALTEEALRYLVAMANGDARVALNALEFASAATPPDAEGRRPIGKAAIEEALQQRALLYDRAGDQHYQVISAFIKSVRGSDPDAAVYWLARMLEAGEDPLFVARRLVLLASEDVGLADPHALPLAMAAHQAVQAIGMPEGYLPLTETTLYLSLAPKSNSALTAYASAVESVRATLNQPVPLHLRNATTALDRAMGNGRGYRYAHDHPEHFVAQEHLPEHLAGHRYYQPGTLGWEGDQAERLARLRRAGAPPHSLPEERR